MGGDAGAGTDAACARVRVLVGVRVHVRLHVNGARFRCIVKHPHRCAGAVLSFGENVWRARVVCILAGRRRSQWEFCRGLALLFKKWAPCLGTAHMLSPTCSVTLPGHERAMTRGLLPSNCIPHTA